MTAAAGHKHNAQQLLFYNLLLCSFAKRIRNECHCTQSCTTTNTIVTQGQNLQ